ncbi:hypothetical protein EH31_06275 [Erythrobacter longus]|uniref:Uncharacterized protein n=1 Tax=Erythrobacter longus TaxID=1044 RepID=A0A074M785_ERYLO|nr:hypothetical protein EH31_06275 [Erythrobacter longus]
MPPIFLQFLVSLIAILALFALARAMKLGGQPKLTDKGSVAFAAGEVEDGYVAERVAIARGGDAALARNAEGRIMVIKRHGNRFAGRVLTPEAKVREEVDAIIIDCDDVRFGKVRLSIDDPGIWVDAINRL